MYIVKNKERNLSQIPSPHFFLMYVYYIFKTKQINAIN